MRIIAGIARGRKIEAPEGINTRPVTDKIKESLFNMWQMGIVDSVFLDLFSGSGSMGLEALSRGARKAIMVDSSTDAVKVIKNNLKNTKLDQLDHQVVQADVFKQITKLSDDKVLFDIIYADPPFTVDEIFHPLMESLGAVDILQKDGILAVRTLKEKKLHDTYGNLVKYKEKFYGISCVHFYELKEEVSL